jgi:hypothetical protein
VVNEADFDLAFGLSPNVIRFAAAFGQQNRRKAICWLDWPEWMYTNAIGELIPIMNPAFFTGNFDYVLGRYFARVSNGVLHFNLFNVEKAIAKALTVWELRKLSTEYRDRVKYYLYHDNSTLLQPLDIADATQHIDVILGQAR